MGYSGARGTLIYKKNLKSKISCQTPFKSWWSCISKFSQALAYRLQNPPANGRQKTVPEELSQTLLANKMQGKF
jgi:hypothetical protein